MQGREDSVHSGAGAGAARGEPSGWMAGDAGGWSGAMGGGAAVAELRPWTWCVELGGGALVGSDSSVIPSPGPAAQPPAWCVCKVCTWEIFWATAALPALPV